MTKAEIEKSLIQFNGNKIWISNKRLKAWYGRGFEKFSQFVESLDYRVDGSRKEYFIPDVAREFMNEVVRR